MSVSFARGSSWRFWDLHVHTPGTALEDGYPRDDWEGFLTAIETAAIPPSVIGVTDYFGIEGYERLLRDKQNGRLPDVDLLLPNIEFRVLPPTQKEKSLDLHLLVSPEDEDHVERIQHALATLTVERRGQRIHCTRHGLTLLGRVETGAEDDKAAYRAGAERLSIDFEVFRDWREREKWLRKNSVLVAATHDSDGTSGYRTSEKGQKGRVASSREEVERYVDMFFSGRPGDREFWLGKGVDDVEAMRDRYGSLKACVTGSDAHNLEKLFQPDKGRKTWIKADPTFEGLRQVLYEPEERVHIGEQAPERSDKSAVITRIRIENGNGWFADEEIEFNSGLVTIIGNRGSGKTALADLVAAASSADVEDEDSFLARSRAKLPSLSASLVWGDGATTEYEPESQFDRLLGLEEPRVRYLSQNFVERLCSADEVGTELLEEIESVIFAMQPEEERSLHSSFSELRSEQTAALTEERRQVKGELLEINTEISELASRKVLRRKKAALLKQVAKEREDKRKLLPKFDDKEVQKAASELERLRSARKRILDSLSDIGTQLLSATKIRSRFKQATERLEEELEDIRSQLISQLGITEESAGKISFEMKGELLKLLADTEERLSKDRKEITGDPGKESDLADKSKKVGIDAAIESREKSLKVTAESKQKLVDLQKADELLQRRQSALEKELKAIDEDIPKRLRELSSRRRRRYERFFELLDHEATLLQELYRPLREDMAEDQTKRRLEFFVRRDVDVDAWVSRGLALFDQRKTGQNVVSSDALEGRVRSDLLEVWRTGEPEEVNEALERFREGIGDGQTIRKMLKDEEYGLLDFANWLYETEHVSLRYGIRFDGVDLAKLSPGTKGIVLMMLFLAVDQHDRRPLIIDQPEENLDSRSVFELLCPYFREAKRRRQVILVTHNPNLVVNTDADQVIVAANTPKERGLPFISYAAGALENMEPRPGKDESMHRIVCHVLEGGWRAFKVREGRYAASSGDV